MAGNSARAFARGVGSIADIGGTNYKKSPVVVVKRGDLASDQRAIARDLRAVIRRTPATRQSR